MSCPKWLPKDLQNSYHVFNDLSRAIVTFKWLSNRYLSEINLDVPDIYVRDQNLLQKPQQNSAFVDICNLQSI